jgi:hypothetical protein
MKLWQASQWSDQLVTMFKNEPERDTPVEPNEKGNEREPYFFGEKIIEISCRNRDNKHTNTT